MALDNPRLTLSDTWHEVSQETSPFHADEATGGRFHVLTCPGCIQHAVGSH